MTERCVDANVAIKWVIATESDREKALALLQDSVHAGIALIAPPLFPVEVDSIIRTRVHRRDQGGVSSGRERTVRPQPRRDEGNMRGTRTILLALGCLLMFASAVEADQTAEARKAITALYEKEDAAISRKDVIGATAHCTSDYVSISTKGVRSTLTQQRQTIQTAFQALQHPKSTSKIQKFQASGNTYVVTVRSDNSATMVDPQTHGIHNLGGREVDRDTWLKTPKGWRQRRSEALSTTVTMDGKPIKP